MPLSKDQMREYQRKRRAVNHERCKPCKPDADVNPDVNLPEGWDHVRDYIKTPGNLAKMRAVCGALGKQAGAVRFGAYGPTAQEIGQVIGTGAPIVTPVAPPVRYMPPMISVHALLARAAHGGRPL